MPLFVLTSRMARFATILVAAAASPALAAADVSGQYLCEVQFAAGMAYSSATHQWHSAVFAPSGKFRIRLYGNPRPPNSMGDTFYIGQILDADGAHPETCTGDGDAGSVEVFASAPSITCRNVASYWLNLDSLRFAEAYPVGYYNGEDRAGGDDPVMLGGTCKKVPGAP